jgi:hypothetical protein
MLSGDKIVYIEVNVNENPDCTRKGLTLCANITAVVLSPHLKKERGIKIRLYPGAKATV